jgi:hypothetical protein
MLFVVSISAFYLHRSVLKKLIVVIFLPKMSNGISKI